MNKFNVFSDSICILPKHKPAISLIGKQRYLCDSIITRVGDPDLHGSASFWEPGPGSVLEWKSGSRSALKSKYRSLEAQHGGIEGRGRSKWSHGGSEANSHRFDEEQDLDRIKVKSRIRICIIVNIRELLRLKIQNGAVEGCGRTCWRRVGPDGCVCRPVVSQIRITLM